MFEEVKRHFETNAQEYERFARFQEWEDRNFGD